MIGPSYPRQLGPCDPTHLVAAEDETAAHCDVQLIGREQLVEIAAEDGVANLLARQRYAEWSVNLSRWATSRKLKSPSQITLS